MFVRFRSTGLLSALVLGLTPNAWSQVDDRTQIVSLENVGVPARTETYVDPSFGVTVRRLTDQGERGGRGTAEYPQLQAFNSDETRILVSTDNGFQIMSVGDWQITHDDVDLLMPRWSTTDPNVLFGYSEDDLNRGPLLFERVTLSATGMTRSTVIDLGAEGFTFIDIGSWESLSSDGNRVVVLADRQGTTQAAVLDVSTGQLGTIIDAVNVDWASISPSGKYIALQYKRRGTLPDEGLVLFDANTGDLLGHASDHMEHGDLGVDANGNEVFVTMAFTDLCENGERSCYSVAPLPDAIEKGTRVDHYSLLNVGNYSSCRNLQRGGFCLHGDDISAPGSDPMAGEIWLTRLTDGAVQRLAHHRSSSCEYYNSSRPTLSPTGRYALYTSDWASPNCNGEADLYLIDLQTIVDGWADGGTQRAPGGNPVAVGNGGSGGGSGGGDNSGCKCVTPRADGLSSLSSLGVLMLALFLVRRRSN